MIKDFLILNCIGVNDKIGLKFGNKFYIHDLDQKVNKNDQLVSSILNLVKKYKVNINNNFSILVNNGPGSFSTIRVALAVAKGIKIAKRINLFDGVVVPGEIDVESETNMVDKDSCKKLFNSEIIIIINKIHT